MKKSIIVFLLFFMPSLASAMDSFKIVYFDSYPPLSWDEGGKMQGILVDIMNETVKLGLNYKVEHTGHPWKRAQLQVRKGEADAFVTVPTQSRLEYTKCSQNPALTVKVGLYTYADHPRMDELLQVRSYEDLAGFTVVEYIGNEWAKEKFRNMDIEWASTLQQTFEILARKRSDILVRNSFNYNYFTESMNIGEKIVKLPAVLSSVDYHLCIGKTSQYVNLIKDFDRVILTMKASGKMEEIFARYGK